jgi:nucleotide-binding universal stress UspA family protein
MQPKPATASASGPAAPPKKGLNPVSYKKILVHLGASQKNTAVLAVTAALASRFSAGVTGFAACQPAPTLYNEAYIAGDFIEADRAEIDKGLSDTREEFHAALKDHATALEWRQAVTLLPLHELLANEARAADLIVTGAMPATLFGGWTRHANNGDLVMRAGRPVLVVPDAAETLCLDHVLVGYCDMREARRALLDAIPLLSAAGRVTVVEMASDAGEAKRHVEEVAEWLRSHGAPAEAMPLQSDGHDIEWLQVLAETLKAGLIVAGAYGHSRLREWALGGMTYQLLHHPRCCALVSH